MIGARPFVRAARAVPGTSLLPVPFVIAAAILAILAVTLVLDAFAQTGRFVAVSWLSVGNVEDARAILGAILGSVSTVLALIFSVTLLVFSMAVNQFGPRLMPYFLRDRTMQVALGLFLGTFLHSLLAFVVTGQRGSSSFVPQLTVLTSVVLVFVSFCYLVVYNHRIALVIQTNNVLAHIVEDLNRSIEAATKRRGFGDGAATAQDIDEIRRRCQAEGSALKAGTSGYVQTIDHFDLVRAAGGRDVIICMAFRPGEFVLEGEALAYVLPGTRAGDLAETLDKAVVIGQHRTLEQDLEFAFAQLSEIAIRALSPAFNDTYTGLSCIDWLGDALRMLASSPASQGVWHAGRDQLRLLIPPLPFARVVHAAFDLIRDAGAHNPAVLTRILQTCARLAPQLRDDDQRRAIDDVVEAVHESVQNMRGAGLDRDAFERAYRRAHEQACVASSGVAVIRPPASEPVEAPCRSIA